MREKIKDTLEIQWIPAISSTIIILTFMLAGFSWTISRIDQQSMRIDQQCIRTDKLYEMFIDLLKEGKK